MGYASKENMISFASHLRGRLYRSCAATFSVSGWTAANGKYTQSKSVANNGAFVIKNVLPPLTTQTGNAATDATKRRNLGTIAQIGRAHV